LKCSQPSFALAANFFVPFVIHDFQADLIHLGAKFGPCMRYDQQIFNEVESTRAEENKTACCIRNDNSGCAQTQQKECSVRQEPFVLNESCSGHPVIKWMGPFDHCRRRFQRGSNMTSGPLAPTDGYLVQFAAKIQGELHSRCTGQGWRALLFGVGLRLSIFL
jgi:hypothetical protein